MRREGFYYWRGHVLPLFRTETGNYAVRVPADLIMQWRVDMAAGRVRAPN